MYIALHAKWFSRAFVLPADQESLTRPFPLLIMQLMVNNVNKKVCMPILCPSQLSLSVIYAMVIIRPAILFVAMPIPFITILSIVAIPFIVSIRGI